jgi:hypothetical protein
MVENADTLRTCLYRLAELIEQARLLPLEDRAHMERMIAQARQAVCEARQGKRRSLERRETVKAIVLRCLAEGSRQKVGLRITEDDTPR